jgi:hypothetical protein
MIITNFLCDKSNALYMLYQLAVSMRIIKTEKEVNNKRLTIEFWDISDTKCGIKGTPSTKDVDLLFKRTCRAS